MQRDKIVQTFVPLLVSNHIPIHLPPIIPNRGDLRKSALNRYLSQPLLPRENTRGKKRGEEERGWTGERISRQDSTIIPRFIQIYRSPVCVCRIDSNGEASRIAASLYRVGLNACVRYWRQLSVPFYFILFFSLSLLVHLAIQLDLFSFFLFFCAFKPASDSFFLFLLHLVRSFCVFDDKTRKESTLSCTRDSFRRAEIDCSRIICERSIENNYRG